MAESAEARCALLRKKAIRGRCNELTNLAAEGSTREIQDLFPQLVRDIFGCSISQDWGIFTTNWSRDRGEIDVLENFLSPQDGRGIFRMIDRLEMDEVRFDLPLSNLSQTVRNQLQQGIKSPFYAKRIKTQSHRNNCEMIVGINLSAFEYYFFHFANSLLSASEMLQQSLDSNSNNQEDTYSRLVALYLNYFLPADGSPIKPTTYAGNKSTSLSPTKSIASRFHGSRLLKPTMTVPEEKYAGCNSRAVKEAVERSDVLVQIFAEVWLNCDNPPKANSTMLSNSMQQTACTVPSYDHVRIVRRFIKHMHYFCNSGKEKLTSDVINYSLSGTFCATESLRRTAISEYVSDILFRFLDFTFDHWPVDSSFRVVLETWLSFVQPWRYLNIHDQPASGSTISAAEIGKWRDFIHCNIAFYTSLLHKYFVRAFRSNLSCIKEALLLMRVMKIMSQPELTQAIDNAETLILSSVTSTQSFSSDEHTALVYMQKHLENISATYRPIFDQATRELIKMLLKNVIESFRKLKPPAKKSKNANFIASVFSYFTEELETEEEKDINKALVYLDQARIGLVNMYKIPQTEESAIIANVESKMPGDQSNLPDHNITQSGLALTPLGRYQVVNRIRKFDQIPSKVTASRWPIRRNIENAFLVRLLYRLAVYININVMGKSPSDDPGLIAVILRYCASYNFMVVLFLLIGIPVILSSSAFSIAGIVYCIKSTIQITVYCVFLPIIIGITIWIIRNLFVITYQQIYGNNTRKRTSVRSS